MKYRYYRVTALVAVAQYEAEDLCDDHANYALPTERTVSDVMEFISDSEDYLLDFEETEHQTRCRIHIGSRCHRLFRWHRRR
jgi:hypothetical protein